MTGLAFLDTEAVAARRPGVVEDPRGAQALALDTADAGPWVDAAGAAHVRPGSRLTERLSLFLGKHITADGCWRDPWYYHLQDCEVLAAGFLRGRGESVEYPYRSEELSRRIGVEPPGADERHSALADARWCVCGCGTR